MGCNVFSDPVRLVYCGCDLAVGILTTIQRVGRGGNASGTHDLDVRGAAAQLFALTNLDRTSNGRRALLPDDRLSTMATSRAEDMIARDYFSHQIPPSGITVVDLAAATETPQAVAAIADIPGPVYLRLKRGEIPVIFPEDHRLSLGRAQILIGGPGQRADRGEGKAAGDGNESKVALIATGMMVAPALAAATVLQANDVATAVVNVPVIKPLDTNTVLAVATAAKVVITAENHTVVGGLGSAVAEAMAEAALPRPLHRIGLADTFAEGAQTAPYLVQKYGLTTQHLIQAAWSALDRPGNPPPAQTLPADEGEYAPV